MTNAIDYSPKNSTITISLAHYDAELVIRIVDNGIGIPEKDQGRIFEPFYRGENTVNVQGTGLGLSVVSEAIRTHEGRIELESQLGVGTTMTLRLPSPLCDHSTGWRVYGWIGRGEAYIHDNRPIKRG